MHQEDSAKPSDFEPALGRDVAAILNPAPLTIIGAYDESPSRAGFATVLWAMPVSHDPAIVAFALRRASHTMGIIVETGCFSLSTLPADAEGARIVDACGKQTGHKTDKGMLVEHELIALCPATECSETGKLLPVPRHALSWELCEVESIQEAGDHLLVTGRVLRAASRATRDAKGRLAPTETLLCIQHDAYAAAGCALQSQNPAS